MGLHAHIHQSHRNVTIALTGQFRNGELDQVREIIAHFRRRGCRRIVLDVSHMPNISSSVRASLDRLIRRPTREALASKRTCAIRPQADTPAARPQTGCGDLCFPSGLLPRR